MTESVASPHDWSFCLFHSFDVLQKVFWCFVLLSVTFPSSTRLQMHRKHTFCPKFVLLACLSWYLINIKENKVSSSQKLGPGHLFSISLMCSFLQPGDQAYIVLIMPSPLVFPCLLPPGSTSPASLPWATFHHLCHPSPISQLLSYSQTLPSGYCFHHFTKEFLMAQVNNLSPVLYLWCPMAPEVGYLTYLPHSPLPRSFCGNL